MKKTIKIYGLLFLTIIAVTSCGIGSKNVDICRCLTEPGNTEWNQENKEACDDAISKEIGVDDWNTVNMSQDLEVSAKWGALAKRCQVNKVDFKEIFKDFTQDNNQNIIITVGYINDTQITVKHNENSKVITLVKIIGSKKFTEAINGATRYEESFEEIINGQIVGRYDFLSEGSGDYIIYKDIEGNKLEFSFQNTQESID